jgi:uridine phosphorylase
MVIFDVLLSGSVTWDIVYELDYGGQRLAVVHPGVGASSAAARLEHMIALGCRKFVACGGAGVLVGS